MILAAGALTTSASLAQQADLDSSAPYWTVTVKGTVGLTPAYIGSSDFLPYGTPGISFRRAGTPASFSAPDDGVSLAILDMGWIKAGPVVRYIAPRSHHDYSELTGLKTINWALAAGGFVDVWETPNFRSRVELMRTMHEQQGFIAKLGEDWVTFNGPWTYMIGPRLQFGNDHYTSTYFSVTQQESLATLGNANFLPAYHAKGGLNYLGVAGSVTYDWSKQWSTTAFAGYNRLTQSAARSPITNVTGSRNQFTFGATVAYSFDMKQFW
ncbi:MipA/OmpV family protein [Methylovirgula sp. 4M-Z18]|nr:MipA/OmpV family protein [Methylovirgula sp. 4M-Z18]